MPNASKGKLTSHFPSWIDDSRIAFVGNITNNHFGINPQEDVVIYKIGKTNHQQVTNTHGNEFSPQRSFDGRLVYGIEHPMITFPEDEIGKQIMEMIEDDILISKTKTQKSYRMDPSVHDNYFICLAENKNGTWITTPLKIETPYFKVAKNKIIYTEKHRRKTKEIFSFEENTHLFVIDMNKPKSEPLNLTKRIKKELGKLK